MFFANFQHAWSTARAILSALWLTSKWSASSVQVRTWRAAPLQCERPLWMLISYSIRAKTASNPLIYLQARADSLSLRLTDALADTFGGWWRRRLSHRVAPAVCLWRGEGGGREREVGRGRGRRGKVLVWTPRRAKQNKEEAENNLKVGIDPAPVIVHIFHSPTGPIPVSLKCKETEKGN